MKKIIFIACAVLGMAIVGFIFKDRVLSLVTPATPVAENPKLQIMIDGVRSNQGIVHVMVYRNPSAFNQEDVDRVYKYVKLSAVVGKLHTTFWDLPVGKYAVMFHHDENGNDTFDILGGHPLEGYAYSNNAGLQTKPTFEEAAFNHGQQAKPLAVGMVYYK